MANYHRWLDRLQVMQRKYLTPGRYLSLLMLLGFVIGAVSYHLYLELAPVQMQHSSSGKKILLAELEQQAQRLAARNLELSIERQANKDMQAMFAEQHQKQQELSRELAFYRSVMSPGDSAEGIAIYDLELTPGQEQDQYRLKLILTQQQKRRQQVKGKSEIVLLGLKDGKATELSLSRLNGQALNFEFRYFQILETHFQLPAGFSLLQIKARVTVPRSRWNKQGQTERLFDVAELLAPTPGEAEKEPGVILEQNSQVKDNSPQQTDVRGSND
jgi:hypothetical protein